MALISRKDFFFVLELTRPYAKIPNTRRWRKVQIKVEFQNNRLEPLCSRGKVQPSNPLDEQLIHLTAAATLITIHVQPDTCSIVCGVQTCQWPKNTTDWRDSDQGRKYKFGKQSVFFWGNWLQSLCVDTLADPRGASGCQKSFIFRQFSTK